MDLNVHIPPTHAHFNMKKIGMIRSIWVVDVCVKFIKLYIEDVCLYYSHYIIMVQFNKTF